MKYGRELGCRYGNPHEMKIVHENPQYKWEACIICNKKFKWKKGYKGRVENQEYLKAHVRNFCQRWGATKRVYMRTYQRDKCIIHI